MRARCCAPAWQWASGCTSSPAARRCRCRSRASWSRARSARFRQSCARSRARIEIERRVGKEGVLERYLTSAPMGGNLEGVRAASLAYFGKEPLHLTLGEAALLVALPQAPEWRRPDKYPLAAERARARVLKRAFAHGVINAEQRDAALAEPIPRTRSDFPAARRPCGGRGGRRRPAGASHQADDRRAPAGQTRGAGQGQRRQARRETLRRDRRDRQQERRDPRPRRRRRLSRRHARRLDRHVARAALAGLGAETLHLCARLRAGRRPSRDAAVRPSRALRRLSAREFRPGFSGQRDGAQGACSNR